MPWDIAFINGDKGTPLGSQSFVIDAVARALPGTELELPPSIPNQILEEMPPILREAAVNRTHLEGTLYDGDLSIHFCTKNSDPVTYLHAEVRGTGNPFPALSSLSEETGWSVWDLASDTVVDVSKPDESSWREFCDWRDRIVSEIDRSN